MEPTATTSPCIEEFTVGWICALQEEYNAARKMLDQTFKTVELNIPNDCNTYAFGSIHGHNVVIASLPNGRYGTVLAANVATRMVTSFPNLRFGLMVGIAGGAPSKKNDIRLGDVVVSSPQGTIGGTLQHDLGKRFQDGSFKLTGFLSAPPDLLLSALRPMEFNRMDSEEPDEIAKNLQRMAGWKDYQRPTTEDHLYRSDYRHVSGMDCRSCDASKLVDREPRAETRAVTVHYGIIASGDTLLKDAPARDRFANDAELNVLCFEMEAAGVVNSLPCMVIRGICDYCDTHKNDHWHNYAALAAAAYARELLRNVPPRSVGHEPSWSVKIQSKLDDVYQSTSKIDKKTDSLLQQQQSEEETKILDWLTSVTHGPEYSNQIRKLQPGTGGWLLESHTFHKWLKTRGEILFCPGIPGAGKTVITSGVIEHLMTQFRDNNRVGVAYIFCNYRKQNQQDDETLFSSLLKQLCQGQTPLPTCLRDLYSSHEQYDTRPTVEELIETLQPVVEAYDRIFLIVDALDECKYASTVPRALMTGLLHLQAKCGANLFATSRFIPGITCIFRHSPTLEVQATSADMIRFLRSEIHGLPYVGRQTEQLQQEICSSIADAAGGMFLLAKLYLALVLPKTTPKAIRTALQQVLKRTPGPSESDKFRALNDAYDDTMGRIDDQHEDLRRIALRTLSWITIAECPLEALALRRGLAVEPDTTDLNPDNILELGTIISACAGMITLHDDGSIRLVHHTAQEYLQQNSQRLFPKAQTDLAEACIRYLMFDIFSIKPEERDDIYVQGWVTECAHSTSINYYSREHPWYHIDLQDDDDRPLQRPEVVSERYSSEGAWPLPRDKAVAALRRIVKELPCGPSWKRKRVRRHHPAPTAEIAWGPDYPFFCYATRNWGYHARKASDSSLLPLVTKLLTDSKRHSIVIPQLWSQSQVYIRDGPSTRTGEGIHIAAYFAIDEAIKALTLDGIDVNVGDVGGATALLWAIQSLRVSAVETLLKLPTIDANAHDDTGTLPIMEAVRMQHYSIVKLLLESGKVNTELKNTDGQSPFEFAIRTAIRRYKRRLAGHAIPRGEWLPVHYPQSGENVLDAAAECMNGKLIAKLFIDIAKLDINQPNDLGVTPLMISTANEEIFHTLVAGGTFDLNTQDSDGFNLLHAAARGGLTSVIQFILDNGGMNQINSRSTEGITPLLLAVHSGHLASVKMILNTGKADINLPDNSGRTPLMLATGNSEIFHALLDTSKCRMDMADKQHRTILAWAIQHGDVSIVKFALEKSGVDYIALETAKPGFTPLMRAVERGDEEILRLILNTKSFEKQRRDKILLAIVKRLGHTNFIRMLEQEAVDE